MDLVAEEQGHSLKSIEELIEYVGPAQAAFNSSTTVSSRHEYSDGLHATLHISPVSAQKLSCTSL